MTYINPRSKLFAHLDTLAAIQSGERPAPVNVELFLSHRCNHGCSWCHYAYTHTKGPLAGKVAKPDGAVSGGDLMTWDLAKSILKQLAVAGVKSVTFSGGGEPTIHRQFDDIAEYAYSVGLDLGLYTHGGNIDDERADLIKQLFTWVYVSLDECTAEAFKASKGVNRFDAVLAGVRRLVEAKGEATIGLGFLLHKGNLHQVADMVKLGRSLGVDHVQFRPTIRYAQDDPGRLDENTDWISWAIGFLNPYQGDSFVSLDIDRFRQYQHWQGHGYSTCYGAALQTAITPNGMVWRCTNKVEHPSALLGDLSQESFADLWARSGGPCAVDRECRVMCKQHLANLSLEPIMTEQVHANFI